MAKTLPRFRCLASPAFAVPHLVACNVMLCLQLAFIHLDRHAPRQVLDNLRAEGKAVNPCTGFWLDRGPVGGRVNRGGTGTSYCHRR